MTNWVKDIEESKNASNDHWKAIIPRQQTSIIIACPLCNRHLTKHRNVGTGVIGDDGYIMCPNCDYTFSWEVEQDE